MFTFLPHFLTALFAFWVFLNLADFVTEMFEEARRDH